MTIGEVSKKFNLSIHTLRYYEKIGLIHPIEKVHGKRVYTDYDLTRIHFILCMKNAGFCLDDIIKFILLNDKGDDSVEKRIEMLLEQKEKLLEEIENKRKTLDFLEYKIDFYNKKKKESLCKNH